MSVADKFGFGPRREVFAAKHAETGELLGYVVRVTPNPIFAGKGLPVQEVDLTISQYEGYKAWLKGNLIQDVLPGLSADDHERLMSGLGPEEFNEAASEED